MVVHAGQADEQAQQAPVVSLLGQGALQGVAGQGPVVEVGQQAVPQGSAQLRWLLRLEGEELGGDRACRLGGDRACKLGGSCLMSGMVGGLRGNGQGW